MSTTIQFSDAIMENGFATVQFTVENSDGATIEAATTVVEPRPNRVSFITDVEAVVDMPELSPAVFAETTLDPNEHENGYQAIVAELLGFRAQTLILPSDNPQVALAVAHQVISGGRYDWG